MTDRMDINRLLTEMRSIKSQTQTFNTIRSVNGENSVGGMQPRNVNGPSFGDVMSQAVDKVNSIQKASGAAAKAYVQGDPNVDITDVMIASQKSSVAFQAMTQVRNKVVEAYRDVMNMPI